MPDIISCIKNMGYITIPYLDSNGIWRNYIPDFFVKVTDSEYCIIETKGAELINDPIKKNALEKKYANNPESRRDEAMRSCGFAGQTIMLAARQMGLDSCPMVGFEYNEIAKIINLPDDHIIVLMIVVGKSAEPANPRGGQLALDQIVFKNKFNFAFYDKSFRELIIDAGLVISNVSSTCIESLAFGVPVIILQGGSPINQNPIPNTIDKNIWDECDNNVDFYNAFKRLFIEKNILVQSKAAKLIRKEYFEPVNTKSVNDFLEL